MASRSTYSSQSVTLCSKTSKNTSQDRARKSNGFRGRKYWPVPALTGGQMRRNDDRDQDTAGADERPSPLACLHRALRRRPHWRHPRGAPGTPPQGPRPSSLTPVRPHAAARDVAAGEPHRHSQCNRLPLSGPSQGPLPSRAPHSVTLPGHCPEKDPRPSTAKFPGHCREREGAEGGQRRSQPGGGEPRPVKWGGREGPLSVTLDPGSLHTLRGR